MRPSDHYVLAFFLFHRALAFMADISGPASARALEGASSSSFFLLFFSLSFLCTDGLGSWHGAQIGANTGAANMEQKGFVCRNTFLSMHWLHFLFVA